MLVHISITDPGLQEQQQRIAAELRRQGDDVIVGDGAADGGDLDHVRHADAVIRLAGDVPMLHSDGTQRGEHEIRLARDLDLAALPRAASGP